MRAVSWLSIIFAVCTEKRLPATALDFSTRPMPGTPYGHCRRRESPARSSLQRSSTPPGRTSWTLCVLRATPAAISSCAAHERWVERAYCNPRVTTRGTKLMLYSFWSIPVAYLIIIEIGELLNERAGDLAPIDQRVRRRVAPAGGRQSDCSPHRAGNGAGARHFAGHSQWQHRAHQRKHAQETGRLLQSRRRA